MKRLPLSTPATLTVALALLAFASPAFAQTAAQDQNAATPDQTVVLSPFEVNADTNVGYGAKTTSSSGRIVQDYVDVPQTVTVITKEFMEDFDLTDSRQALQAAIPGIQTLDESGNGTTVIRGEQTNVLYIDGMVESGGIYGSLVMASQFFDRIEVVKGPTSAAFGVGQPGGIINYVTKTPQGINSTEISTTVLSAADHPGYNFMIDSQGVSGKLSYRIVAVQSDGKSANYGGIPIGVTGAQLALDYNVNSSTKIQFIVADDKQVTPGLEGQQVFYNKYAAEAAGYWPFAGNPHPSIVFPSILPVQDEIQNPGFETSDNKLFRASLVETHNFNEHTSVRNATVIDDLDGLQQYSDPSVSTHKEPNGDPIVTNFLLVWPTWAHAITDTLDFVDVRTGPGDMTFKTLLGGDYNLSNTFQSFGVDSPPAGFDPWNPHPINIGQFINPSVNDGINGPDVIGTGNTFDKTYGFYVQEDVGFWKDRINLSASWRIDYVDLTQTFGTGIVSGGTGWANTGGTPRYAVTIKPQKWLSFYGLYSVHVDPPKTTPKYNISGEALPQNLFPGYSDFNLLSYQPKGYTIEGGAKASLLNGNVTASVAVYHEIDKGTVLQGPAGTYTQPDGSVTHYDSVLIGGPNIYGVEADITGKVTQRLVFDARFGFCNGMDVPQPDGYPSLIRPATTFGFNGKYDFGSLHGDGFYITGGLELFGKQIIGEDLDFTANPGGSKHVYVYIPTQYLVAAGVGYRWNRGHEKIYLSSTNLTNRSVQSPGMQDARLVALDYTMSF